MVPMYRSFNITSSIALAVGLLLGHMPHTMAIGDTFTQDGWRRTVDRYLDGATPYDRYKDQNASITELERMADHDRTIDVPRATLELSQAAMMYQDKDRPKKAEDLYKEVLQIRQNTLPPNHPDIAAALHNLGAFYEVQKDPDTAAKYYQQAIDIWESSPQSNKRVVTHELADFGDFYWLNRKSPLAEPIARRALALSCKLQPPDYELTRDILQLLATTLDEQGKFDEVQELETQRAIVERKIPIRKDLPSGGSDKPIYGSSDKPFEAK